MSALLSTLYMLVALNVADVSRKPCDFDIDELQFAGSPNEQARCLLREVQHWGHVANASANLPAPLSQMIGSSTTGLGGRFVAWLRKERISDSRVGGNVDRPLSRANGNQASAPTAKYFVIHDTSSPLIRTKDFPADNSDTLNGMTSFAGPNAVAHVFVNRRGETLLGHDFEVAWRATKFESRAIGAQSKGLFLHVELLQPRMKDESVAADNDANAPNPGFTQAQYDALALLYTAASVRSGHWLIPAYHAVLDENFANAHDDPQNFQIERFSQALERLVRALDDSDDATTAAAQRPPWISVFCRLPLGRATGLDGSASAELGRMGLDKRVIRALDVAHGGLHGPDGGSTDGQWTAAVDISVKCLGEGDIRLMLNALADRGFASWYRQPGIDGWTGTAHVHAIWVRSALKSRLREQVWSWLAGRNGLKSEKPYKFWSATDSTRKAIRDSFVAANSVN